MTRSIPIIDLETFISGSDRESVVSAVDAACREVGFLVITGHGIPAEVIEGAFAASARFFDEPTELKEKHHGPTPQVGYQQVANMSLGQLLGGDAPPDLREGFIARRQDIMNPDATVWDSDAWFREAVGTYYSALNELADTLMRAFALAHELPEDYFVPLTDAHDSNIAIYHYPGLDRPPLPGQLRGGPHTDFGGLTILAGSPSVQGLQIWDGEEWEDAPIVPGAFVVNLGDLMARWTNDRWRSTLHQVANPVDSAWDQARYSIVFFHKPNADTVISSLDRTSEPVYEDITAGEHFRLKAEAMAVKSS